MGPGVKIVLATDSSLSVGFSRELLLRWGGDKRCKVILTGEPEAMSLGAEILAQIASPPVIVSIETQEKVLLTGNELKEYLLRAEEERKAKEESELQRKRELELSMVFASTCTSFI